MKRSLKVKINEFAKTRRIIRPNSDIVILMKQWAKQDFLLDSV